MAETKTKATAKSSNSKSGGRNNGSKKTTEKKTSGKTEQKKGKQTENKQEKKSPLTIVFIVAAIILIITKKTEKSEYMAFGPYIVIATIVVILFGTTPFINAYFAMCSGLADYVTEIILKFMK